MKNKALETKQGARGFKKCRTLCLILPAKMSWWVVQLLTGDARRAQHLNSGDVLLLTTDTQTLFLGHLVDRAKFDPIVPAANPIKFLSVQNHVKKRITSSVVKFNDFTYKANFNYLPKENLGIMKETFSNENTIRQQEHKLYMPTQKEILNIAMNTGFILLKKLEMKKINYDNQFIYVLQKPN